MTPIIFDHLRTEVPSEPQRRFFESTAKYTAYGGARGGGKSWALRRKLIMLAMRYENLRLLLIRRTMPELRENHILPMSAELNGYAAFNREESAFRFPNGSRIALGYCDNAGDVLRYQGREYDVIAVDEATAFPEEWCNYIFSTLRTTRTDGFRCRVYLTCNPGGVGHAWVKRLFVDRDFRDGENPDDYLFIQAKVTDNKALMLSSPDYVRMLDNLPPAIRAAHRDGSWDVYEGCVFSEFRRSPDAAKCAAAGISEEVAAAQRLWTHVIAPFNPPSTWRRLVSFDYGSARPFSAAWWAVDGDGRMYRILELYGCQRDNNGVAIANTGVKWTPDEIFSKMREIQESHPYLRGHKIYGVADPAIWDKSTGVSINDRAEENGIYFDKGDHKRIAGLQEMHRRLQFDENGIPMMYIFSNCKDFIRTVPALIYDRNHPEDVDSSMEDHAYDEARYCAMLNVLPERKAAEGVVKVFDPLEAGSSTYRIPTIYGG